MTLSRICQIGQIEVTYKVDVMKKQRDSWVVMFAF